uniref:Putative anthocyanin acyltransferase n=1 Tax=Lobelia erinus TaxID=16430 RepID=B0I1H3_LOBER|nr:putative anthocyanin acyltransferase [Lobelia erinus]
MAAPKDFTVLEHSRASPPAGSVAEKSFTLNFLDMPWPLLHPIHQLCFYDYPHSDTSHFTQTVVPKLKDSLSITLQHFFPFAGNLIVFPYGADPNVVPPKPEIRYMEGDSVCLTICECTKDFNYLTGNYARKADEYYPLVPKLGDIVKGSDYIKIPVLAIQLTLFPNRGFCIGVTNHHSAADGNARINFLKFWAKITKSGNGDSLSFLATESLLPFCDKSLIKDPRCLDTTEWSHVAPSRRQECQPPHLSGNPDKLRITFIVTREQINRVKKSVLARRPTLEHLSTFTIACGLVWVCSAKVCDALGEYKGMEDDREQFICVVDGRSRMDPPIPSTYFGNCLVPCIVLCKRNQLLEGEGLINAVEFLGGAIRKRCNNKDGIFAGAESWGEQFMASPRTTLGVAGSPKFSIYDTDFGWGKPSKCEAVSIDYGGTMSLSDCKDSKEDVEIGLLLAKNQLDVFNSIFTEELKSWTC